MINPFGNMDGPVDPGDLNMIMGAHLFNSNQTQTLTIISGEFVELNGVVLQPKTEMMVNLSIPAGYREYINQATFKGKNYLYVGLRDKDQAAPIVYEPNL